MPSDLLFGVFDTRTALLMGGFAHLVMPLAVWAVLHARHDPRSLWLWNSGSLLTGVSFVLIGLRGLSPDLWSIGVANLLAFFGYALRGAALQREAGHLETDYRTLFWPVPAFAAFCAAWATDTHWRLVLNAGINGGASLWLAWLAFGVARRRVSRSGRLLGWAFALFGSGAVVRTIGLALTEQTPEVFALTPIFLPWVGAGTLAGLYSSVGFIGIALENARQRELRQTTDLARQQLLREQAEQQAVQLSQRLGHEEEVLRLLAHEVRQPLHNAMAALQGARSVLEQPHDPATVRARIGRAEQVIHQIVGTLDNTLAATALLARREPAACHDADIDMLLSMSIADLPPADQPRIHTARESATRTASLDPSLMRLALRNLLANACTYTQDHSPVHLTISDQDEPLALIIEVSDTGPGVALDIRPRLFEAGARGNHGLPGHGLGLYVVRRVMELHHGTAEWRANTPQGSVFRLVIPQA